MNFVEVKKKEKSGMKNMGNNELAANNIKKFAFINLINTAGIVGINACGDEAMALSGKQEAPLPLGKG